MLHNFSRKFFSIITYCKKLHKTVKTVIDPTYMEILSEPVHVCLFTSIFEGRKILIEASCR